VYLECAGTIKDLRSFEGMPIRNIERVGVRVSANGWERDFPADDSMTPIPNLVRNMNDMLVKYRASSN